MKGIPEIRFNKYSEKWESLNAGTLFYPVTDKGYPELPVLSASQEEGMIPRKDIGIDMSYSRKNVGGYKRVLPGDFVVHLRSFQGGFAHSASEGITSPGYTVLRLNKERNQDDNFWKHYMTSMNFIDSLRIVTYGIRDGRNINVSEFLDTNLIFPKDKQEQTAIGKFFDDLDEYISSQALELQKLKNIKKACLEKMFPKEGELVPEIRFNGFEGNWVIKTLGELFTKVTEKNIDNSLTETFTNSAQEGIISQRDYFNHDISNIENINVYYVVRPDDFVYNPRMSVTAPVGPINRNKLLRSGVMSPLYSVFRAKDERTDLTFLEYFFKTGKWYNFMWKNGDNGARGDRFSIRDEVFQLLPIIIPPSKKEQISIANYFSSLDKFICSTSNKLDKLKQIRKGLLEKMFIANN